MRKPRPYAPGQRFQLTRRETMYDMLDAGLTRGAPVVADAGLSCVCIDATSCPGDVLCEATINGAPAYGWIAAAWLEPISAQKCLFECDQPSLFKV
jgi:hypothetical protein